MKYTYAYKTSDGTRHEATMEAATREAVFERLRGQGIKAIKVVAADGSKANGEVRGVRKRVVVLGAWCLVLGALFAGVLSFRAGRSSVDARSAGRGAQDTTFLTDTTRRQVIGDAAVIEKGIRTGWADVFEHEGERFLASFAIPGVKAGVRNTSVEALEACLGEVKSKSEKVKSKGTAQDAKHPAPSTKQPTTNYQPTLEARQIIAMVEGMKREARSYIAAGGTAVEYGKRLVERQDAEIALCKRVEAEVLAAQKTMPEAEFSAFLDQRNDELRNLGIRPVTLSE